MAFCSVYLAALKLLVGILPPCLRAHTDSGVGAVIVIFMTAQIMGATFFAGTRRGIQVPLNAASYVAWGYRGLVNNEFYNSNHRWDCSVRPREGGSQQL